MHIGSVRACYIIGDRLCGVGDRCTLFLKRREAARHIGSVRVCYKGKRNVRCGGCEQKYPSDFEKRARVRLFLEFDTQQKTIALSARKLGSMKNNSRAARAS